MTFNLYSIQRWLIVATFFVFLSDSAQAKSLVVNRKDLKEKFAAVACRNEKPTTEENWQHQIFETQITFGQLTFKKQISKKRIHKYIVSLTKKNWHNAYTFGDCANGRVWYATFPSIARINKTEPVIDIDLRNVKKLCRSVAVYFASHNGGRARRLTRSKLKSGQTNLVVNTNFLPPGTVSLNCRPYRKNVASVLWQLIPVHQKTLDRLFSFDETQNTGTNLVRWVNRIRSENLAKPVQPLASPLMKILGKNETIFHLKKDVERASDFAEENGFRFIGENRVIGRNAEEMAKMLWLSPSHRNLLLNSSASHIDIKVTDLKKEKLAIIVMEKR